MGIWLNVEPTDCSTSHLARCLEVVIPPEIRESLFQTKLLDMIQDLLSRWVGIGFILTLLNVEAIDIRASQTGPSYKPSWSYATLMSKQPSR